MERTVGTLTAPDPEDISWITLRDLRLSALTGGAIAVVYPGDAYQRVIAGVFAATVAILEHAASRAPHRATRPLAIASAWAVALGAMVVIAIHGELRKGVANGVELHRALSAGLLSVRPERVTDSASMLLSMTGAVAIRLSWRTTWPVALLNMCVVAGLTAITLRLRGRLAESVLAWGFVSIAIRNGLIILLIYRALALLEAKLFGAHESPQADSPKSDDLDSLSGEPVQFDTSPAWKRLAGSPASQDTSAGKDKPAWPQF